MNNKQVFSWQHKYNAFFTGIILSLLLGIMWVSLQQGYKKINDQFFQKNFLIEKYNQLRLALGDKVFSPNVLIGADGWMEYTGTPNLDDYQNAIPFTENELNTLNQTIEQFNLFGAENNIEILIVIAPNKATIYPDKIPNQIKRLNEQSRLDQLVEYIPSYSNIQILDLRDPLIIARKKQEIYFKTDTHWNLFGAYQSYFEIIKILSIKHPELHPFPMDAYQFEESNVTRDLPRLIKANYILENTFIPINPNTPYDTLEKIKLPIEDNYLEIAWTNNNSAPTALVFSDSFGRLILNNYLSLNFSKTYFISNKIWKYFSSESIEYIQPNIIIIELVERNLADLEHILAKFNKK